ncbi:nitrophenyl compound nitroreductase subunit ArsF family protein [Methanoplanus endosymbiosus]|uniref:Nitrophenyl compound nitroreductase subunit ArsF family protein n=1 Tax=Methanoplanus endosymbiosus TaxID=33865 RepID=A0A9E7PQX8_9EURY|nr:nitrophenyl compound nitroreductase subunit ArsF family protein [Methanoplanus endosymbiosus]UUX93201.1 nitrophenyl compound nitroreductase subunit ArsF family protein [Methanoplanus endosymbiosus]
MRIIVKTGIIITLLSVFFIAGCTDNRDGSMPGSADTANSGAEKIELYHFYTDSQCYSCVVLGELANDTVQKYYKPELDSGRLVFAHINIDDEENSEISERYGAAGSSLWIGVYNSEGEFYKEDLVGAWYRLSDPESYSEYLRGILDPLLGGSS